MEEEYVALMSNDICDFVPRTSGDNVVISRWIFKHKFKVDRSLERYKAHWVIHGFTQCPDVNYDVTFSPVAKPTIVHTVLFLAFS
jgi:hypothetical protein